MNAIKITKSGQISHCRLGPYDQAFGNSPKVIETRIAEVGEVIETEGANGYFWRLDSAEGVEVEQETIGVV